MNINITKRTSKDKQKVYYTFEWGRSGGQRMSTGVFTYLKPKDQIQKNHNKEALLILEFKRSQMVRSSRFVHRYLQRHQRGKRASLSFSYYFIWFPARQNESWHLAG